MADTTMVDATAAEKAMPDRRNVDPGLTLYLYLMASVTITAALGRYIFPQDSYRAFLKLLFGEGMGGAHYDDYTRHPAIAAWHFLPGILYMAIGPLQFVSWIRRRHLQWHRWIGRFFLALTAVVVVSSLVVSYRLGFSGAAEGIQTTFYAVICAFAAAKSFWHVRHGEIALHREWMIRSFAVGLGGSTSRLTGVLIFHGFPQMPFSDVMVAAIWTGWTLNLIIAEIWIATTRAHAAAAIAEAHFPAR
jgi:uncharacterized membrane protein